MPTNYGQAFGRFRQLVKRFNNDEELLKKCSKIIQDQFDKGVIEEVTDKEPSKGVTRYLSWHPVITPNKTTTKVRLVYDASARPSGKEQSLNDLLHKGPTLLPDLCGLLLRFREPKIGLIADIEKAFLQIGLHENDKDCTRFLWFKDPTKPTIENNLVIYRFARVAFGVISSPFLLNATVKHHLDTQGTEACGKIANSLYVDNLVCGTNSLEEAKALYTESKEVFTDGAMNLREWLSNSTEFQEFLPEKDRVENRTTKVLGLSWNSEEDTLKLSSVKNKDEESKWTKRKVLQTVASLFDPLGFTAPVSLTGKLFIKKLWSTNHQWDDPISADLTKEWELIIQNYENVNKIEIPRFIGTEENSFKLDENYELHTFVDASKDAFCAAVYLLIDSAKHGKKIQLLFSKSRIAPKKVTSLPRLELLAALIGIRAMKFVEEHMNLEIQRKFLWSDSEIVLHWIKSNKPLKVFVENRIREIRQAENVTFCYVNTTENPADIGSRGCSADELLVRKIWWNGPDCLQSPEEDWPVHNLPPLTPELLEEMTKEIRTTAELTMSAGIMKKQQQIINPEDHSSLSKLLRVTAYCLKFIREKLWKKLRRETQEKYSRCHNLFTQKSHENPSNLLTPEEIAKARIYWDRRTQNKEFSDVKKAIQQGKSHQLVQQLRLYEDENEILRCTGRIQESNLPEDMIFPKLLPVNSRYTHLVIMDIHKKNLHAGIQRTLSLLRENYWVLKGRQTVRKIVRSCIVCTKVDGGPYIRPIMPRFPAERVKEAAPFSQVGVDYLGPFYLKGEMQKGKAWICLFSCMITRAIHLEVVTDCSAKEFLDCFKRFIARRGRPNFIISDNAQHFQLTGKMVEQTWPQVLGDPEVMNYYSTEQIEWRLITEFAPWQGAFYERMVGLTKRALKKTMGRRKLTLVQLITLITEIEGVLNSRPISYVYEDIDSWKVLRPIDFIQIKGQLGTYIISDCDDKSDNNRALNSVDKLTHYWKSQKKNLDIFWSLWSEEYLLSLRERTDMHRNQRIHSHSPPKLNAVVLIKDPFLSRGSWKIGRIISLNESYDGHLRSVDLQLPNGGVISRPINLLYPVEVNNKTESEEIVVSPPDIKHFNMNTALILADTTIIEEVKPLNIQIFILVIRFPNEQCADTIENCKATIPFQVVIITTYVC